MNEYPIEEVQIDPKEAQAAMARERRNALLQQSDVYVLPDYPHKTDEDREAWLAYRAELRAMPQRDGFPSRVVWPKQPKNGG